jgi:hypothetical protein
MQINTPGSLRFCRTKSLNSPQILGVLSVKFQHFDLLQPEFRHFQKKFLLWKHKLHKNWTIRLLNNFQRISANFEKKFWLWKLKLQSLHLRINRLLLLHLHSFRQSIRESFQTFRRSSHSSDRGNSKFYGGAVAMVSKHKNFTADVTVTQTLWLWFWTRKGTFSAASLRWNGNQVITTGCPTPWWHSRNLSIINESTWYDSFNLFDIVAIDVKTSPKSLHPFEENPI